MAHFYRHSGIVPVGGLVQTIFAGLGSAISLGIVYSFAMVYVPIIYLNFLGTAAFGFAIGYLVNQSARAGRIRNHFVPAMIGCVSAVVGLYFAWGADMLARKFLPPQVGFLKAFDPHVMWIYMQWCYENGTWSLGRHAQENVKGIFLAIVWLAETLTIVGLATHVPWNEIRSWVFCENCGWWETIESNLNLFSAVDADKIAEQLKNDDLTVLRKMTPALPTDMTHLRLHLARCETCDDGNYVDLEQVTVKVDKKGNLKTVSKRLVEKLQVAAADVPLVREAGPPAANITAIPVAEATAAESPPIGENDAGAAVPGGE